MSIIKKTVKLTKEDYYKKHLNIINYILPEQLTKKEVEFLSWFMCLEGELKKDPFSTTGRKIVQNKMSIHPGGVGNYLRDLKKKNFIIKREGRLQILPILIPSENTQEYSFKLIKEDD